VTIKEPQRTAEGRFKEYGQNVPLPAVALNYLIPPEADMDNNALQVAATILSGGRSSRLYQSLVYQQQLATSANAGTNLHEDISLFNVTLVLASGKKPEMVERSLLDEIKKMQDAPVSAAELEKAKNQLVTSQLRNLETNNGKADALGEAAVLLKDPNRANTDTERLQSVTAADVQRVMQKYFTDQNRVVLYYLPESERPKGDK
jgi:zinc protease